MNGTPRSAESFFAAAIAWSWAFWGMAVATGANARSGFGIVLLLLGGLGPAVAALVLVAMSPPAERITYRDRLTRVRGFAPAWYVVALLLVPLLAALAAAMGAEPLAFAVPEPAWRLLPALVVLLLFGPLPEELGWRGFALDRLQAKSNALSASLKIGVIWAIWHLPLFAIDGTWQHGLGLGGEPFWGFMLAIPFHAILLTWIYNNTGGSIPAAVLMHLSINVAGEWIVLGSEARHTWLVLIAGAAAAVTVLWGPATMRQPVWSKKRASAA